MSEFWNNEIEVGYYDKIVQKGMIKKKGPRSYWHITTLLKVGNYLNDKLVFYLSTVNKKGRNLSLTN